MRPIVLYHLSNLGSRQVADAVASAIGAEVAALGDNSTPDLSSSLGLAFDTLARELPDEVERHHQNFDLVVFGDSHIPGFSHNTDAKHRSRARVPALPRR